MFAVSTNNAHQAVKSKPSELQMLIKGVAMWLRPAESTYKHSDWPKLGDVLNTLHFSKHLATLYLVKIFYNKTSGEKCDRIMYTH